jgi:hypothetical protein
MVESELSPLRSDSASDASLREEREIIPCVSPAHSQLECPAAMLMAFSLTAGSFVFVRFDEFELFNDEYDSADACFDFAAEITQTRDASAWSLRSAKDIKSASSLTRHGLLSKFRTSLKSKRSSSSSAVKSRPA